MTDTRILQLNGRKQLDTHTFSWNIKFGEFRRSFPHVKYGGYRWDVSFREIQTCQPNSESDFWLIITVSSLKEPLGDVSLHQRFVATICDDAGSEMWSVSSEVVQTPFSPTTTAWMNDLCLLVPGTVVCNLFVDSSRGFLKLAFIPSENFITIPVELPWERGQTATSSLGRDSVSLTQLVEFKVLSENIKSLLLESEDSDVTLDVSGRVFRAHKNILRARSPVFYRMFLHDLAERQTGQVAIPDCDGSAFEVYLNYIYSGSFEGVASENVGKLQYIARKYGTERLNEHCLKFMQNNLTLSSFVEFISAIFEDQDNCMFLEHAVKFFAENFDEIGKSAAWAEFLQRSPLLANELMMRAHKMVVTSLEIKKR